MFSKVLIIVSLFILPGLIFSHGSGISIEATVDGYLLDIGLSEEVITNAEPVRIDFSLFDESTSDPVNFSDIWLRINQEGKVFFAGGVSKPQFGLTGVSYMFLDAGEYTINVRYQKNGKAIVEHSFMVTVSDVSTKSDTEQPFKDVKVLALFVLAFIAGFGVAIVTRKRPKAWTENEASQ